MNYLAIILICLSGMPPKDCQVGTAVDVMFPPEPQLGLGACMVYGLQFAAESQMVIAGKTWPKVYCAPPTSIGKSNVG